MPSSSFPQPSSKNPSRLLCRRHRVLRRLHRGLRSKYDGEGDGGRRRQGGTEVMVLGDRGDSQRPRHLDRSTEASIRGFCAL
ncbi:hypothetical protein CRG98_035568 [Punica granatum]|uniref:Uncharacterized protein n=1 Tax=Punica granatum TaxID=22663 RepID=A0A2I0IJ49_PUNGR|nr:hypothetical protein CRG98_035568 [Punica granatum]